ncbi:hypothetical protein [Sinorhizobium meliloti]|uniref:hypothetical protein n=1 Tax=Rhizobium meliloti TaxID=382 RepID=UPI001F1AB9BD|nr:hypothetical protein [Sinorhizobium meliloti]
MVSGANYRGETTSPERQGEIESLVIGTTRTVEGHNNPSPRVLRMGDPGRLERRVEPLHVTLIDVAT